MSSWSQVRDAAQQTESSRTSSLHSATSWQPDGWSCSSGSLIWLGDSAVSSLRAKPWWDCVMGEWCHCRFWRLYRSDKRRTCPERRGESYNALEAPTARCRAGTVSHSDARTQDALRSLCRVDGDQDGNHDSGLSQFAMQVQRLFGPAEVLCDVIATWCMSPSPLQHWWLSEGHAGCVRSESPQWSIQP